MKRRALEPIRFDPLHGTLEHVGLIMVEAEHKAAVDLNAIAMKHGDSPRVVLRHGRPLAGGNEIATVQRLESNEHTSATCQRHVTHERGIVSDVDRDRGTPNDPQRPQCLTESAQIVGSRTQVIVDEHNVGLAIAHDLFDHLLHLPHSIRHMETVGRQIAKATAVVASPRRNHARRSQERVTRQHRSPCRRVQRIGSSEIAFIARAQAIRLDVPENDRPQLHAVSDRYGVGVLLRLVGTRQHMQAAQNDKRTASAIPGSQLVCPACEGQMDGDTDYLWRRIARRRPLEQILVPVSNIPMRWRGARNTGESQRGSEDVLAVTGPWILGVKRVYEECGTTPHRPTLPRRAARRIESRSDCHIRGRPHLPSRHPTIPVHHRALFPAPPLPFRDAKLSN